MPVEPFDATDENGVRVTGTAEAYRDRNGPFHDPSSEFYQNPRYSDHAIDYLNTRDVCRINPDVLGQAVQKAFQSALVRLGIDDPKGPAVRLDVDKWIAETLRQCALHSDKYVSNQSPSSVDPNGGMFAGDQSRNLSHPGGRVLSPSTSQPGASTPAPVRYLSSYRVRP